MKFYEYLMEAKKKKSAFKKGNRVVVNLGTPKNPQYKMGTVKSSLKDKLVIDLDAGQPTSVKQSTAKSKVLKTDYTGVYKKTIDPNELDKFVSKDEMPKSPTKSKKSKDKAKDIFDEWAKNIFGKTMRNVEVQEESDKIVAIKEVNKITRKQLNQPKKDWGMKESSVSGTAICLDKNGVISIRFSERAAKETPEQCAEGAYVWQFKGKGNVTYQIFEFMYGPRDGKFLQKLIVKK